MYSLSVSFLTKSFVSPILFSRLVQPLTVVICGELYKMKTWSVSAATFYKLENIPIILFQSSESNCGHTKKF